MPALDFSEIAPAHEGINRDQFEMFARDFLEAEGFEVVSGPDRGVDAGRDLIVRERREGPGGVSNFGWLVSCKHKAGSGSSVSGSDEINLRDRIETHNCHGFIAFYSTLASSTIATHLRSLSPTYGVLIFDPEKIESKLLDAPKGRALAARYFPISFQKWVLASQYVSSPIKHALPLHDRFFMRQPHADLKIAQEEADARNLPVFIAVYDEHHSTRSRLDYCLAYFMEWETTKRLVDENFVVAIGPSSNTEFGKFVPDDDPLEECRWIVVDRGITVRSESFYANPSEGRKRVLQAIAATRRSGT